MKLSEIIIDENLYPRPFVDEANVQRIIHAIEAGIKLPEIIIEAKSNRLVDGRHRHEAYKRKNVKNISVIEKIYNSEADLFADAVRLNVVHGKPLDRHDVEFAIKRLSILGYEMDKLIDVVKLPKWEIEKITKGDPDIVASRIAPLVHKPHSFPKNSTLNAYEFGKLVFYAKQIINALEHGGWPDDPTQFAERMDKIYTLFPTEKKEFVEEMNKFLADWDASSLTLMETFCMTWEKVSSTTLKKRKCLKCQAEFISGGSHQRLCLKHRHTSEIEDVA